MRISYGPPGHKGVSSLLAVGADEYASSTDKAIQTGTLLAGVAALTGLVIGSGTLARVGVGALGALLGVRFVSRPPARPAPIVGN